MQPVTTSTDLSKHKKIQIFIKVKKKTSSLKTVQKGRQHSKLAKNMSLQYTPFSMAKTQPQICDWVVIQGQKIVTGVNNNLVIN